MSMTSSQTVADIVTPGRYQCPACPVRSETVGDKRRHIKADHSARSSKRVSGNPRPTAGA